MHELAIAYELVQIAEQAALDAGVTRVKALHLRLGVFSGVVEDALQFGYEIATEGTVLAGSNLVIEPVPLVVHCPSCDADVQLDSIQLFVCPDCGTPTLDIQQGKEIQIDSLELFEDETETA
jgi:hydrogenase nickel incorporation protein HypA/HybF